MTTFGERLSDDDREALDQLRTDDADYLRGHRIEETDGQWVYCDTGEPVAGNWQDRPCGKCGLPFTEEGHDGCIGTLPGVVNACCGHGDERHAYVQFEDGAELREGAALEFMEPFRTEAAEEEDAEIQEEAS